MFDHHSEPRECRPNGVPYAAFGLLWRVLGAQLVGEHQARLLDENFIQPLDLNDNTAADGIVYDVGGGMFDHHSEPRECRPNGVPYAAFGLLWRVLGAARRRASGAPAGRKLHPAA